MENTKEIDREIEFEFLKLTVFHVSRTRNGTPSERISTVIAEIMTALAMTGRLDNYPEADVIRVAQKLSDQLLNELKVAE